MATTTAGTRRPVCPYLPPEIWHRILLEYAKHTTRTELWTFGRRVCSPWRSELAKVFTKKSLENVNLVQTEPDFGSSTLDRYGIHMQQLRSTFVFNRYEQDNELRCVFAETLDSITEIDEAYDRKMFAAFEERIKLYLGDGTGSKSARFDLPPYRIRVGPKSMTPSSQTLRTTPRKERSDLSGRVCLLASSAKPQLWKDLIPGSMMRPSDGLIMTALSLVPPGDSRRGT